MAVIFRKNFKNNNNSDCLQDSCIISTALPIFFWSMNLMELFCSLWCKRKSESQDGASQRGNTNISACILLSCKIPTAKLMFSKLGNSMEIFFILCDASGSQKSKMADHTPEKLISQSVYDIAAQFQRLYPCFQEFSGAILHYVWCKRKGRNPIWPLTIKKYSCLWAAILNVRLIAHHALLRIASMSLFLENIGIAVGIL